ncbi:hypothetical protein [Anaeromyxobacter paludicola]|uniref:hypothetical protein n=1 Tax=Anaeromyxobacter paludicola TaxID=2918171 RepID=UPI0020C078C3|nr:hypothetical protein [Anaeromyxobacter paludicola]
MIGIWIPKRRIDSISGTRSRPASRFSGDGSMRPMSMRATGIDFGACRDLAGFAPVFFAVAGMTAPWFVSGGTAPPRWNWGGEVPAWAVERQES